VSRALNETEHSQTLDRARALFWLGEFAGWQGDFRSAQASNEGARALFEEHHDEIGVFRSLLARTEFEVGLGNLMRARTALDEAGGLAKRLARDQERAQLCFKRAQVEGLAGDYERAEALLEEGLQLSRKLDVPRGQWVHQLINVGRFALQQQDFARARTALEEYLAEDSGKTPRGIAAAHCYLGLVALHEGDRDDAVLHLGMALAPARDAGTKRTMATTIYGLAALAAVDGDAERSTRLWSAADVIRQSTDSPLSTQEQFIVERYLQASSATLRGDAHPAAPSQVVSMTVDEALAYAINHVNSAPGSQ
jgi:tetratricopeptide (TPR) repeat protein